MNSGWLPWKRRHPAWQAGADGDVARAQELSEGLACDEGNYLRLVVAAVRGRYEEALAASVAFAARGRDFARWGVHESEIRKKFFDSPLPLALGGIVEEGLMFFVEDRPSWSSFGGVRIDGLVSHAFLSKRAWTLDFDRHRFVFSG
jgi:hypothetical protein